MQDLAERLLAARRISLFALDQARARAHVGGLSLADALVEGGAIPETELLRSMARELDTRFVVSERLRRTSIPSSVAALLPVEVAEKYRAVPVQVNPTERSLVVVMADPRQVHALDMVPDVARVETVQALVALPSAIRAVIRAVYYEDRSALQLSSTNSAAAQKCARCARPVRATQVQCGGCGLILDDQENESGWASDEPSVVRRLIADSGGRLEGPSEPLTQPRAVVFHPAARTDSVPRLISGLDILERPLSEFEAYVAAFVDGALTVSEVAREARISAVETESVLLNLVERGILEFGPPAPEPRTQPATIPARLLAEAEARSAAQSRRTPSVAPRSEPAVRTRNVLELALALERSGALREAIALLKEEIARAPNAAPLLNRLAATLLAEKEYPEAEALLKRATELEPANDVYRMNLESVRARARPPIEDRF